MTAAPGASALRWYLAGSALFLMPGGIQIVLLPWFVAVWLGASAAQVGVAQMASQLPMLLLIVGGVLGDRFDQRRMLITLHLLMALPPLLMLLLVRTGSVTFVTVVMWALCGALFAALAQPARDALLSRVIAAGELQRGVVLAIGVQLGVQVIGFALGASADALGVQWLLTVQLASVLLGAVAMFMMAVPDVTTRAPRRHVGREMADGLAVAFGQPAMRAALCLTLAIGVFFAGTFMVALPLIVRDVYAGGAAAMAAVFAVTLCGAGIAMGLLLRLGTLTAAGRVLTLAALASAGMLALLSVPLPFWGLCAVLAGWGMSGGICVTLTRTLVQASAPESHRARLMSIYMLALLGGMPLGSLLLGWSMQALGVYAALAVPVAGMLVATLLLLALTPLWRLEIPQAAAAMTET